MVSAWMPLCLCIELDIFYVYRCNLENSEGRWGLCVVCLEKGMHYLKDGSIIIGITIPSNPFSILAHFYFNKSYYLCSATTQADVVFMTLVPSK